MTRSTLRASALALLATLALVACGGGEPPEASTASTTTANGEEDTDDASGDTAPALGVLVPMIADSTVPKFEKSPVAAQRTITFGLPIPREAGVAVVDGRAKLRIPGDAPFHFEALDVWPEGTAKWALGVVSATASPGEPFEFVVTDGPGTSGDAPLATEFPGRFEIDTGPMQLVISKNDFRVFNRVHVDGVEVVELGASRGIVGTMLDGSPLTLQLGPDVTLEENGPARAIVRADGTMIDASGNAVVDVTCRIIAGALQREAEVILTVRNANIDRPAHVQIGGLGVEVNVTAGNKPRARVNTPYGLAQGMISANAEVSVYQAYSTAIAFDVKGTGPNYKPPIPKVTFETFEQEGWRLALNGTTVMVTAASEYPDAACADISGTHAGVTAAIKHKAHLWPASFQFSGDGTMLADVFSSLSPFGFSFIWRQHESRSMMFAFHAGPATEVAQIARRLDNPIVARAIDYEWYDDSGVFPYPLVTIEEENAAFALAGVDYEVSIANDERQVHRFLPASSGGGHNNHSIIERWLIDEFLRYGHGGQLQRAIDLSIYKAEWQVPRSDNFHHADDPGATNPDLDVTIGVWGDSEHRYREGMIYTYYMTGDRRIADALYDEVEIVPDLYLSAQERSTYQTMRALVYLADFVDATPGAEDTLVAALRERIDYFCTPIIDVNTGVDGFGWEAAPGTGTRGYFANSTQAKSEKPDGENYITRGFITATLGPTAMHLASWYLGDTDPHGKLCGNRLVDLARYTRKELYPYHSDPSKRFLVYTYGVQTQDYVKMSVFDFHTTLLGMAEAWRRTGNTSFIQKGIELLEALEARGHLNNVDTRLENQSFFAALLESNGQG